jgi:hypothetical protein
MTLQPHQEPFKQAPISTEQHLTSSPFASPLYEGPCLSPGEGLQEESRRLGNAYASSWSRTNSSERCWSQRVNFPAKKLPH